MHRRLILKALLILAMPIFAGPREHARALFERQDYVGALAFLGADKSTEVLGIKAEALFRLDKFKEAKDIFQKLAEQNKAEAQRAYIRIFECDLQLSDIIAAQKSFDKYEKLYGPAPARMSYALGKKLFDIKDYAQALIILKAIPEHGEFSMRAAYISASVLMLTKELSAAQNAENFKRVALLKPISVEDYAALQLALLAQARIWADARDFERARKAYTQVSMSGAFAEAALAELIELMIFWADSLEDTYSLLAKRALAYAQEALGRYRALHEIGLANPKLYNQGARLLVRTRFYKEARVAYDKLIKYYEAQENREAIKQDLAQAQAGRAELALFELKDIAKKMQSVGLFQAEKIMSFEKDLAKMEKEP